VSTPLPRVTAILSAVGLGPDFRAVPQPVLEAARARGIIVHAAIEADHYQYPVELPAVAAPYLDAYRKFVAESGHEPICSEFEIVHPTWLYCGHPDRIGWLLGRRTLLDWKCTESPDLPAAGRQLSGYRLAWNAQHPTEPIDSTAVVQLKGDGSYRLHELAAVDHEQTFLAAVVVYQARQREGRL
jgi:hypothetical protein